MRTGLQVAATMLFALVVERAGAEPAHHVRLRWRSTDGCIDRDTLASTVEATLGRPVFHDPSRVAATIEGTVGKGTEGFQAHVEVKARSGDVVAERDLSTDGALCNRLDESVAVVVALMVDSIEEPDAPPMAPSPPTPLRVPREPPRVPLRIGFDATASAILQVGLLPRSTTGIDLGAGVAIGTRWSLLAHFEAWPSSWVSVGPAAASIWALAGQAEGCFAVLEGSRARLETCVDAGAGATEATPFGVVGPSKAQTPLAYIGPTVALALRVRGPLWVRLALGLWVPLAVPEYLFHEAQNTEILFQSAPVVPVVSVGLGIR